MDLQTLLRIQIITLTDSICFGMIYGFINPYLIVVGGNHFIVGIFTVLNVLCQLLSADIVKLLTSHTGKQFSLFIVSVAAAISFLLIGLTNYWWFIILSRCFFTLTNQANSICRELLLKKIPENETEYFLTVHNILSSCGYIIGPILTGCMFPSGFSYICLLAAALTLGNIWLSTTLVVPDDDDEKHDQEKSLMEKQTQEVEELMNNFKSSNFMENWDVITLKFLCSSSIFIFFSKFTQILQSSFDATALSIGITASYMNAVVFAGSFLVDNIRQNFEIKQFSLLKNALCTLLVTLILACYAPTYYFYWLICIPLILARCYLNKIWGKLYASRNNEALNKINNSVGILAGLAVAIPFGITCDRIGSHAVVLFSVVPIIISLLVYFRRTMGETMSYNEDDNNPKNKDE